MHKINNSNIRKYMHLTCRLFTGYLQNSPRSKSECVVDVDGNRRIYAEEYRKNYLGHKENSPARPNSVTGGELYS